MTTNRDVQRAALLLATGLLTVTAGLLTGVALLLWSVGPLAVAAPLLAAAVAARVCANRLPAPASRKVPRS